MKPEVFREYDVRGVAGRDFDEDGYRLLGRAFGTWMHEHGERTIVVGRDVRPTSVAYSAALREGLAATGRRVLDVGLVATPVTVFALAHLGADASAAVTASHNPAEYNGAKLRRRHPVFGQELQRVREVLEAGRFVEGRGHVESFDVRDAYVQAILGRIRPERSLKVVVDAANGCGALLGPDVLHRLGFEVVPLYCDPDGTFPNHPADPTQPENLADLRERVVEERADCGIAWDGDADRVVMVDEKGGIHWPDRVLILLARQALARRPRGVVVHDVKCSERVATAVEEAGGRAVMVKTGYPHVLQAMRDHDAVVGGELSGHLYFGGDRIFDFDDGVFAACRLLEALSRDSRPVSEQAAVHPPTFATPELHASVPEEMKFTLTAALVEAFRRDPDVLDLIEVDGARARYREGWGLVRASNTQPKLVLVFEASDEAGLRSVMGRFAEKLSLFPEIQFDFGRAMPA